MAKKSNHDSTRLRELGFDPAAPPADAVAALRALRDLALDHATGKMSDADYDALRGRQEAVAIEALRRLDTIDAARQGGA